MKLTPLILLSSLSIAATAAPFDDSPIKPEHCGLLSHAVNIKLSAGISGSWSCNETMQNIKVAVCSKYGSRKPAITSCRPTTVDADGVLQHNAAICSQSPSPEIQIAGEKAFVVSSLFPAPAMISLNTPCNTSSISSLDFFKDN